MEVKIRSKTPGKIYETSILQQTAFWSRVKRMQGVDSKAFEIQVKASDLDSGSNGRQVIVDDILILFDRIGDGFKIAYVPYGPTIHPSEEKQGLFLEALSESLRSELPSKCVVLRYDLLWESPWAKDNPFCYEDCHWIGPPAKKNQEIRMNFETRHWNLKKANTNILPADTNFIDLRKTRHQLLNEMKPKTRYNIGLSHRRGVRVRKAGFEDLGTWYKLYKQTCLRNKMCLQGIDYFKAVLEANAADSASNAKVELLIAETTARPLAAMFLVFTGQRATYLYGASSSVNRGCMPAYALQWSAIERARSRGYSEYDMFGLAPQPNPSHPLYGLYRFKTGFGGRLFHRMGCWDYPLDVDKYEMYLASEMHGNICYIN